MGEKQDRERKVLTEINSAQAEERMLSSESLPEYYDRMYEGILERLATDDGLSSHRNSLSTKHQAAAAGPSE